MVQKRCTDRHRHGTLCEGTHRGTDRIWYYPPGLRILPALEAKRRGVRRVQLLLAVARYGECMVSGAGSLTRAALTGCGAEAAEPRRTPSQKKPTMIDDGWMKVPWHGMALRFVCPHEFPALTARTGHCVSTTGASLQYSITATHFDYRNFNCHKVVSPAFLTRRTAPRGLHVFDISGGWEAVTTYFINSPKIFPSNYRGPFSLCKVSMLNPPLSFSHFALLEIFE